MHAFKCTRYSRFCFRVYFKTYLICQLIAQDLTTLCLKLKKKVHALLTKHLRKKQPPEVLCKKGVVKNFANLTGKPVT